MSLGFFFKAERAEDSSALQLTAGIRKCVEAVALCIALVTTIALFFVLLADVVVRYVTSKSLGWPAEMPNLLFPWQVMASIVLAASYGSHISVSALLNMLGWAAARKVVIFIQLVVCVVFLYLTYNVLDVLAVTGNQVFPITQIPHRYAYCSLLFGFCAITIISVLMLARLILSSEPLNVQEGGAGRA